VGAVAVQVSNILVLDKMIKYFLDDIGIVFYTNMVQYPNVLSAQVLPAELKVLAINRLEAIRLQVPTFKYVIENPILLNLTYQQIDGIINFLNAKDQSDKWKDCLEFNRALDNTRNQCFKQVTPEFAPYV
jgi:hypothetical protein